MSDLSESILVINQSIIQGKSDDGEEMTLTSALSLLINRFGYSTQQTQDAISALLTNGKVRILYKEQWQRFSLKDQNQKMDLESAQDLVNKTINEIDNELIPIAINQAPKATEFTQCISIRKPRKWEDLVLGEKCRGYYDDENGQRVTIQVEITKPMISDDYHLASSGSQQWFVANPATVGQGSPNFYYLLPQEAAA